MLSHVFGFGYVFGVRSRVRCSVTFQAQCSCSFVFDTFEKNRVRVRSCSIILKKSVFVCVRVRSLRVRVLSSLF